MKKLLSAIILTLCAWSAAADWRHVTDTGQAVYYDDPATLQTSGPLARIRVLMELRSAGQTSDGRKFWSIVIDQEFHCVDRTMRTLSARRTSDIKGRGDVLDINPGPSAWTDVGRGTFEGSWQRACGK